MAHAAKLTSGYRLRDLTACCVVLLLGTTFIYALHVGQHDPAMNQAVRAFAMALALLPMAYLGGMLVDCFGRFTPWLTRPRRVAWPVPVLVYGATAVIVISDDTIREAGIRLVELATAMSAPYVVPLIA